MGVVINARNARRRTASHIVPTTYSDDNSFSARQTFISVVMRLDPHFDVNTQDMDGYTPLHFASAASESQTFDVIRAGANLNAKSFNLRTPLHCAARGRQSNIIAMLLHFSAETGQEIDINAADVDGRTPLHDACRSGRPESVRLLLDAGANVQLKDIKSKTPLMICAEFIEKDKLWASLRERTCSTDSVIRDCFRPVALPRNRNQRTYQNGSDHTEHDTTRVEIIAKMLIGSGADIDDALRAAVSAKSAQLVAAIREAKGVGSDKASDFAEALAMLLVRNATSVIDSCNELIENRMSDFIPEIDEAMMQTLLDRGVDFTSGKYCYKGTAIAKIVRLGLTEYASKIISKAKM